MPLTYNVWKYLLSIITCFRLYMTAPDFPAGLRRPATRCPRPCSTARDRIASAEWSGGGRVARRVRWRRRKLRDLSVVRRRAYRDDAHTHARRYALRRRAGYLPTGAPSRGAWPCLSPASAQHTFVIFVTVEAREACAQNGRIWMAMFRCHNRNKREE